MKRYKKLIASILGMGATAFTIWTGIPVPPEVVSGVGGLATSFLVWLVSNHQ